MIDGDVSHTLNGKRDHPRRNGLERTVPSQRTATTRRMSEVGVASGTFVVHQLARLRNQGYVRPEKRIDDL